MRSDTNSLLTQPAVDSPAEYTAPAWVAQDSPELSVDLVNDLLVLHERLLTTTANPQLQAMAQAAAPVVRQLIRQHTRLVGRVRIVDVRVETIQAVTEILRVVRKGKGTGTVSEAFEAARGWAEHATLRVQLAHHRPNSAR